jgi:pimeloyl-ACP methyl ester carboxylesterase
MRITTTKINADIQGEPLACVLFEPEQVVADAILVHGFTGSKEDFTEVAEFLAAQGYRTLTFDNRGQHESSHSKRADAYEMDSLARDVIDLAAHFSMSKPHLLGHSFGGLISQRAVTMAPTLFSSLTLMCSGPGGREGMVYGEAFETLTKLSMEEIWYDKFDEDRKTHPRYEIHKKRWIASDGASTYKFGMHLNTHPSYIKEVAATGIPAFVFYGENDDAWPQADQDQMAKEMNAKLTVLPQCAHCPNEDNPALTADTIAGFWKNCDSTLV